MRWQLLRELTLETWSRLVDVNLRSVLLCAQAFLPQLELRGGSIVNVASTSALVGAPDLAAYSATKGGVVAATRALAVELAPARIRVNAVWLASDEAAFVTGAAIVVDGGLTAA